ncbi:MAG: SUMF1/EgtB/PvdO family nonheme iron enzyme [Caldilineaceae bacterium]|nr:SUMF1/EgtB/PvdO family nonheme iron enzyme [Caldilineaceae bacterium]
MDSSPETILVGQQGESIDRDLNRALDAWWQQGQLPTRGVLRDALLALQAGHRLDDPQRALLLRAALFYGRGMITALHYQSDPERTASIMRDMLLHIQRPLNPAQIAQLVREDPTSGQWLAPLLRFLHEESSGGLEPRRTLATAALLYLTQKPIAQKIAWTPPGDLVGSGQTAPARRPPLQRQPRPRRLRALANVLALIAFFLLAAAIFLLWQEMRQDAILAGEMRTIPSGAYLISAAENGEMDRLVEVTAFSIDRTEVTNRAYRRCYEAGVCSWPAQATSINRPDYFSNPAMDHYPMININWFQAKTYCEWAGRRLPLVEEWEIAAGSALTLQHRYLFPWGDQFDPQRVNSGLLPGGDTQPVAAYSPSGDSPAGVADMAGNVAEWTATPADPDAETPAAYLVKGGSFLSQPGDLRVSARQIVNAEEYAPTLGFRCALTLPSP